TRPGRAGSLAPGQRDARAIAAAVVLTKGSRSLFAGVAIRPGRGSSCSVTLIGRQHDGKSATAGGAYLVLLPGESARRRGPGGRLGQDAATGPSCADPE